MLAGDISTGKTSFITQLIYQTAERNPKPTENLTFFALRLTNPNAIIQIWDSPGNARFKFQVFSILANFKALLLFVDVTNEFTLHKARTFI
jgi:signal recognition particle receptor subunit beta